ncbi:MAG: hypothetical protein AAF598_13340, partial [Bacteroidota bacterium]
MQRFLLVFFFLAFAKMGFGQSDSLLNYRGNWERGLLGASVSIDISLIKTKKGVYDLSFPHSESSNHVKEGEYLNIPPESGSFFSFRKPSKKGARSFLKSGILMYHIAFHPEWYKGKRRKNSITGTYRPMMVDSLLSSIVYLNVEGDTPDQLTWYPFFGDHRFTGTWAGNFNYKDSLVLFTDFKTGMEFELYPYQNQRIEILIDASR